MAELGFGFLRMAHKDGQIDYENLNEMVDLFMAGGGRLSTPPIPIWTAKANPPSARLWPGAIPGSASI